jgi:AmpD protein
MAQTAPAKDDWRPSSHAGLDSEGWLIGATHRRSPHCDLRPEGTAPDLLVIHNISLPAGVYGGQAIEQLFMGTLDCNEHPSFADLQGLRVSSHFLIRRSGELIQFVSLHERAWHAGASSFEGRSGCNDFSVGVELEGSDHEAFASDQMETLAELCAVLHQACPSIISVAGHSDIAPGRKTDPGPWFDWTVLLTMLRARGIPWVRPFQ